MATVVKKKLRPYRLLLVTFDLTSTQPGDRRYRDADNALSLHGEVYRPVKQLRLLITRSPSGRIKQSPEQRLGRSVTIFLAPLDSIPAWRIHGIAKRREWERFVRSLASHGVAVRYVSEDRDSHE